MIEKITDAEVKSLWIQRLPDAPNRGGRYGTRGMNAAELKAAYDALSLRIVSHYNALVDYLNAGGLAGQLPGAREGTNLEEFLEEIRSGSFSTYLTVDGSRSLSALAAAYDAHTHDGVYAPVEEVEKLSLAVKQLENSAGGSAAPAITVDGTDLPVEDGKVALPIVTDTSESMATGDSALGLCKILPNSMLYASGGAIDVKEANQSGIAQRSSAAGDVVLTAYYVNDIVKAALTDENRISGLTDTEKDTACTVLGAARESGYELIEEITLTEDTTSVSRRFTPDGEEYNYSAITVTVNIPFTGIVYSSSYFMQFRARSVHSDADTTVGPVFMSPTTSQNNNSASIWIDGVIADGKGESTGASKSTKHHTPIVKEVSPGTKLKYMDVLGSSTFTRNETECSGIPAGAVIKIYAKK